MILACLIVQLIEQLIFKYHNNVSYKCVSVAVTIIILVSPVNKSIPEGFPDVMNSFYHNAA